MQYDDLFDRETLSMMSEAQRKARSRNKPAITCYMAAEEFIDRDREMSQEALMEYPVDIDIFKRMVDRRIEEMPTVSEASPFVDDELDSMVRNSVRRDGRGNIIAGSVTARSLLQRIVQSHLEEYSRFANHEEDEQDSRHASGQADLLEQYSSDLTELAASGELSQVTGRDEELQKMLRVLIQKAKCNPVLVGEAGVGKTAIVEGLAVKAAQGDIPQELGEVRILSLDTLSLLEKEGVSGVKSVLTQLSESDNVIMFIDEIHTLPRLVIEIMKPFMARGRLKVIGATTDEEFSRLIEVNKAFARRLQKINVEELSTADTLTVLRQVRHQYEQHHGIRISDEALEAAVSLSQRYVSNRRQPDKSLDLVDEATAKVRLSGQEGPVTEDDIREVLAKRTGIPVEKLSTDEMKRLLNLEDELKLEVIGQDEAVSAVAKAIRRNGAGLSDAHRPVGSFLFNGSSGVGKTKLALALAKAVMGSEEALKRFDMSEYQQPHTVSRLIGSPPGYVGYAEGGQLTEAVSRQPYRILLFDEIEKAHPDVCKVLLQVLDNGRLTDGGGRIVDFTNTIVIFTANLISRGASAESRTDDSAVRSFFSPEFLNRLDAVIQFNDLGDTVLLQIARKMLSELKDDIQAKGYSVEFDESVARYVIGLDDAFGQGARPIRRAIEQHVTDALVTMILSGELARGGRVTISVTDGVLKAA